jgi:HD-GYP domain-containing protein (c-di-GMP phosphodiesterase class II)/pSer/pThr/pTyr-binding forkhead associated (FHA) protein
MGRPIIILSSIGPELEGLRWEAEEQLRIGRLANMEIVVNDASISRRHAELFLTGQEWVVRDLGSTNGTFLNGARVGRTFQPLRTQDLLQCGNLNFRISIQDNEAEPPKKQPSNVRLPVLAGSALVPDETVEGFTLCPDQHPQAGKHLLTLLRAGYHVSNASSLPELLQGILEDVIGTLEAQRGAIVLADEATGRLYLGAVVTAQPAPMNTGIAFSRSLAERAFQGGESLLCREASQDPLLVQDRTIQHGDMASIICGVLRSPRKRLGILHLDRGPNQPRFSPNDFYLADAISASVSVGIECVQVVEQQRDQFLYTVSALANAVEMRDQYTGHHTHRVTAYTLLLADELGLPQPERRHLEIGTPLHDIGKIAVSDAVLRKPGRLTEEEFAHMKTHVVKGATLLEAVPGLTPILPIIRSHHERWDGSGYPDRLARERISRLARIVAVADAFDAMTSERPYRHALPANVAFAELHNNSGSHFDPECVQAFLRARRRVEQLLALEWDFRNDSALLPGTLPYRQALASLRQSFQ